MIMINKIRGWLYGSAKVLGDIQATQRALEEGSPKPVIKRLSRRLTGKLTARFLGWLHR